ncbi:sulfite exporter TauE/SafE family protein [Roseixanthobacter liquoris]|uniref:sulfite exporter TauE/SafE family protein n=1 Tax=Roseixanthobacter liquoris TaxID=3119921 RepID=UPI003728958B
MTGEFTFVGGALMGLAGSLHCAGLCGGIASSLLLASAPNGAPNGASRGAALRAPALLATQLGRALTYTAFGATVGAVGAGFGVLLELAGAQGVLRALAALSLLWVGASVAGFGPGVRRLDVPVGRLARRLGTALPGRLKAASPLALGIVWGFAPCGMVYSALLTSLLSGSALSGAAFMAGFGLATVPAVAATALGAGALVGLGRHAHDRTVPRRLLGAAICALALASLAEPARALSELCLR